MARYKDAKCRICRRAGDKLMLKGERCFSARCAVERRNAVPGQRPNTRRRIKISDRGLQLREKQKARYTYGIMERQFRNTFSVAERKTGVTGDNLIVLLISAIVIVKSKILITNKIALILRKFLFIRCTSDF